MSEAKVTFHRLDSRDAEPGREQTFDFNCPKHPGRRCEGLIIAGRTGLKQDGQGKNRERPTFTPSVNHTGCWHGYIRLGRTVDCNGNDEP